ncbi:DUF1003 domain-containing protein [Rhizobium sp. L1K21]|uniref:DUF1003 domain-containing protein n=1 Tax=Rhizobium sp. L1K21 TaxID=2954933 RepID=UPI00209246F6|nr:DUF1003 domain-containing protein [Rhizobium sp. L1K21]MCO6187388.1 DUF1003 domain-containing protein [Rhizobium sp. L1K21]
MSVLPKGKAKHVCGVCGESFPAKDGVPAASISPQIAEMLDRDTPNWRQSDFVCRRDLAAARRHYLEDLIRRERGELTDLDREVVDAMVNHAVISDDAEEEYSENATFGEWLADKVATFGGSWTFIIAFALVLAVWMGFNVSALFAADRFDPYPFILLNLALSCLAAIQAPLIMMSQKRQESKDRQRAQNDYQINLKAELEIRQLHEKLDHMLMRQWERLTEIQEVLLEQLEDAGAKDKRPRLD